MKLSSVFMLVLGLCVFTATSAFAEVYLVPDANGDIHYTREQRFMYAFDRQTGLLGANNVVIKQVQFKDLPEFIKGQAQSLATNCTVEPQDPEKLIYYRYTSDLGRKLGFSSSYMIDLMQLVDAEQQSCLIGKACIKGECALVGFKATAYEKWSLDFKKRIKSWEPTRTKDNSTKQPVTLLNLSAKSFCEKDSGDDECAAEHIWIDSGLVRYSQFGKPSEDEEEDTETSGSPAEEDSSDK